jgi:hypothetical protein
MIPTNEPDHYTLVTNGVAVGTFEKSVFRHMIGVIDNAI